MKFYGYMLICQNAERVHGQRKVGNPCSSYWALTLERCGSYQLFAEFLCSRIARK